MVEMPVERMDAERLFSYRWHPYAVDPKVDYSTEPTTLVEFRLEDDGGRHAPHRRRVRLRPHPQRAPRRGVPHERGRLGGADREHRAPCLPGLARSGPDWCARRRSSPRSATRRACGWSLGSAPRAAVDRGARRERARHPPGGHEAPRRARRRRPGAEHPSGRQRERIWELEPRGLEEARRLSRPHLAAVGRRDRAAAGVRRDRLELARDRSVAALHRGGCPGPVERLGARRIDAHRERERCGLRRRQPVRLLVRRPAAAPVRPRSSASRPGGSCGCN